MDFNGIFMDFDGFDGFRCGFSHWDWDKHGDFIGFDGDFIQGGAPVR